MPNTPSLLRKGVSGLYATADVTAEQRDQAQELLSAVGIALWLEQEQQLDAVTAVSGSGPAYFFLLIEAMTAAGVKLGLSKDVAEQLAEQTALGAAHMAVASDVDAAELRRRVTSPAAPHRRPSSRSRPGALKPWSKKHWAPLRTARPNSPNNLANKEPT